MPVITFTKYNYLNPGKNTELTKVGSITLTFPVMPYEGSKIRLGARVWRCYNVIIDANTQTAEVELMPL